MKFKSSLIVVFIVGLVLGGVTGGAYQIGRASAAGNGFMATSTSGYALQFDGNASQSLNSGGMVKAMLYVDPTQPQAVVRCFNSQATGAAVNTPPCGFLVSSPQWGYWNVDFGFDVATRFIQAIAWAEDNGICFSSGCETHVVELRPVGGTVVGLTISYNASGDQTNVPFTVIVY